jgi:hypothetical protein
MKKKLQISKMIASAALAVAAITPSFGQSNLGAACGCPAVTSRPTVLLSSLTGFSAVAGTYGGELTAGAVLTCDKTYIIDQKIYIPSGKTITIAPGTVLKGRVAPDGTTPGVPDKAKASALVIERGGKIMAEGTADCQIVFTAEADTLAGTYSVANIGKWGGLVILGKATNNLTYAANGPFVAGGSGKLAVANGLGTIEGFATSNTQDQYGANLTGGESFDDNDNSGILRYISVRHAGAILSVGAEINGITFGSVGRGTTVEHIEVVSCADDNIELFGGTVNLKYITTLFGNDDMFDYDLGWSGKAQFLFGMKSDLTSSPDSDNGFEADSDDNKSNLNPKSIPVFYNVTLVGNAKTTNTPGGDNTGMFAIAAKELTGGEFYNSVFANWKNGFNTVKVLASGRTSDSYQNWSATAGNGSNILKVKCNTFVGVTNPLTVGGDAANVLTIDSDQFAADGNVVVAGNTLPGFDYAYTINTTTNAITVKNDLTPNPALTLASTCPSAPIDGFYRTANYRGAFSPNANENWLSDWSYSHMLGATKGLAACPTDINADGVTNVNDFLQLSSSFGTSCN